MQIKFYFEYTHYIKFIIFYILFLFYFLYYFKIIFKLFYIYNKYIILLNLKLFRKIIYSIFLVIITIIT